jgi:hypothetical protein
LLKEFSRKQPRLSIVDRRGYFRENSLNLLSRIAATY